MKTRPKKKIRPRSGPHATAGRALLTRHETHHNATPLGWCCHGSLHGPRTGEHATIARLLLEAGAPLEPVVASDEVEEVIADWL